MNDNEINNLLTQGATEFFDVAVNPLAGMFCVLLELLIKKEVISKDEAKAVIIASLDLINQSGHEKDILEQGHEMLLRMVNSIDTLPNNKN